MRTILLLLLAMTLYGCPATTGTGVSPLPPPDPARCAQAQKVLDVASAEVAKYRAAGVMSGSDFETALIAESAARTAMILVCP